MRTGDPLIIKNVRVIDGTGGASFEGEVAVQGCRIKAVGHSPGALQDAGQTFDGCGLCLVPGFIDTHGHSEFTLLADPRAEGKLLQGVTTDISGNCGLSAGPLRGPYAERRESDLREYSIEERWTSLNAYLELLQSRQPAINYATLAGHGNIRGAIMGYTDRRVTEGEMFQMRDLLIQAMEEGALGLSTGLIYPPGVYAERQELIDLCHVLASYGGLYATHMRNEADLVLESLEEALDIGEQAGVPVHVSHLKTSGRSNWPKIDGLLNLLSKAGDRGIRVTCDRYPYIASSTDLDAILPKWVYEGGYAHQRERLTDPEILGRIRSELGPDANEDRFWADIRVSSVFEAVNRWMEGRSILEISRERSQNPFLTYIAVILSEGFRAGGIFFGMSEANLVRILTKPNTMVGSDSAVRCFDGSTRKGKPHPRGFGTFPRYLGQYVRDQGLLPLEQAVHNITGLPASVFGLANRGVIREGAYADLVILDPDCVTDTATYEHPFSPPRGIRHVFVNGGHAVREEHPTGLRSGRVIRRGDA